MGHGLLLRRGNAVTTVALAGLLAGVARSDRAAAGQAVPRAAHVARACGKLRLVARVPVPTDTVLEGVHATISETGTSCGAARGLVRRVTRHADVYQVPITVGAYRCHYFRAGLDVGTETCRAYRQVVRWNEIHGPLGYGY